MMLVVRRSHANDDCKFKVSSVRFVGVRPSRIYYQLKKSLNMSKTCLLYGSTSRHFSASEANFVIFMAQRPSANIALLSESKVYETFMRFS